MVAQEIVDLLVGVRFPLSSLPDCRGYISLTTGRSSMNWPFALLM